MSQYFCPLCKQNVSQALYDRITGVWEEKEKRLAVLREREKRLLDKEKNMRKQFLDDTKRIAEAEKKRYGTQLEKREAEWARAREKERLAMKKKVEAIEKQEKAKSRETERTLKARFQNEAEQSLAKERKSLAKQGVALQRQEKIQMNKYRKLNEQYNSLQNKSKNDQEKASKKIASLEEQLRKDRTPQVLGLLEEGAFLERLRSSFPSDEFEHPGKGGDIIHRIMDRNKEIGLIVYELKKVSCFQNGHITQTFEAKNGRNADYGILVTNAKRSKEDFGFSVAKGVIIIHPAGALVLVNILREHLISIARLKLSTEKKKKAVQAVLDYIQGPVFKNGIGAIIEDTKELYLSLTQEVKEHIRNWEKRFNKYRNIHAEAQQIDMRVVRLLENESTEKREFIDAEMVPIPLPAKID